MQTGPEADRQLLPSLSVLIKGLGILLQEGMAGLGGAASKPSPTALSVSPETLLYLLLESRLSNLLTMKPTAQQRSRIYSRINLESTGSLTAEHP
jgi:hypothetical protein